MMISIAGMSSESECLATSDDSEGSSTEEFRPPPATGICNPSAQRLLRSSIPGKIAVQVQQRRTSPRKAMKNGRGVGGPWNGSNGIGTPKLTRVNRANGLLLGYHRNDNGKGKGKTEKNNSRLAFEDTEDSEEELQKELEQQRQQNGKRQSLCYSPINSISRQGRGRPRWIGRVKFGNEKVTPEEEEQKPQMPKRRGRRPNSEKRMKNKRKRGAKDEKGKKTSKQPEKYERREGEKKSRKRREEKEEESLVESEEEEKELEEDDDSSDMLLFVATPKFISSDEVEKESSTSSNATEEIEVEEDQQQEIMVIDSRRVANAGRAGRKLEDGGSGHVRTRRKRIGGEGGRAGRGRPSRGCTEINKRLMMSSSARTTTATLNGSVSTGLEMVLNNFSNPYEIWNQEPADQNLYQRKMKDLFVLDRFLNQPDTLGFCRRPYHRPFLIRSLFYMRHQQPMAMAKLSDMKTLRGTATTNKLEFSATGSRTSSRLSNKLPATVKFTFLRNNECLGHRSAVVQCFHVSECSEKLSLMRRIPSATFEMQVNQKISNISIDLPDECHAGVLDSSKDRAEYLVVRIVFRLEDAEIGGHQLRKVATRTSGPGSSPAEGWKCLRKNGPGQPKEVVMFGARRIFYFSPIKGLRVAHDECSILLHTANELRVDDLNTRSSPGQLGRLLRAVPQSPGAPFISMVVSTHEDDEQEEEEDEEGTGEREGTPQPERRWAGSRQSQLAMGHLMDQLAEDGPCSAGTGSESQPGQIPQQTTHLKLLQLPHWIALKFWMRAPGSMPFCSSQLSSSFPSHPTLVNAFGPAGSCRRRQKRPIQTSSSEEEGEQDGQSEANSDGEQQQRGGNVGANSRDRTGQAGMGAEGSQQQQPVTTIVRVLKPSVCFFCRTRFRMLNLSTLLKHLRFQHPRFEFTFEPAIRVSPDITLTGFSVSQNLRFDPSFELHPRRNGAFDHQLGCTISRKAPPESKPLWLVTKHLALRAREDEQFPIERFTALGHGWLITTDGCNHIRGIGRFEFETPTRVDQPWLLQMGARKLSDITDLDRSEWAMMQLWNGFLLRIRMTLLGRRMVYTAARLFVTEHWAELEKLNLRIQFLFHLTALTQAGVLDGEERYDLACRMDPHYEPQLDTTHFVAMELVLLERERLGQKVQVEPSSQLRTSPGKKGGGQQRLPPLNKFASLAELRARFPFANVKRLEAIWKFLRPYRISHFAQLVPGAAYPGNFSSSHSPATTSLATATLSGSNLI